MNQHTDNNGENLADLDALHDALDARQNERNLAVADIKPDGYKLTHETRAYAVDIHGNKTDLRDMPWDYMSMLNAGTTEPTVIGLDLAEIGQPILVAEVPADPNWFNNFVRMVENLDRQRRAQNHKRDYKQKARHAKQARIAARRG